jgi:predicted ATPase/DNA-binding CsgD family transcriptional regulator
MISNRAEMIPLVGREREINDLTDILLNTECRLLTVLGPGGIGKTRLVLEVADRLRAHFADGVHIVLLQPLSGADLLSSTVAAALGVPSSSHEPVEAQVIRFLRDKELLLVLDNYEHLLPEVEFVTRLLSAPDVRLLVASREVLNLRHEWLYPLDGLSFPAAEDNPPDVIRYDAARLFIQHAQRGRRDFELAEERHAIFRVSRAVQGMPLGIELAASWSNKLNFAEIASEIEHSIDFLTTNLRDFPERHRSMRAVFDQSWKHLSEKERSVFMKVSVFRGGFQREAAEYVAGASLFTLSSLVDKSLLRREPGGRYQLHELLRQYGESQLTQNPAGLAQTRAAHAAYYVDYVAQCINDLNGGRQQEAVSEITAELENVRLAWANIVEDGNVESIRRIAFAIGDFYDVSSRYGESVALLEKARRRLEELPPAPQQAAALMLVTTGLGWVYFRLSRIDEARTMLERAVELKNQHSITPPPGRGSDPEIGLGVYAMIVGNYGQAVEYGERARRRAEARADPINQSVAYYVLSTAAFAQGRYQDANRFAQQGATISRATGDRWFLAYCLNEMGRAMCALSDYSAAQTYFDESYAIRRDFGDAEGCALALQLLGKTMLFQKRYTEAHTYFEQSVVIYRQIADRGGLAVSLSGLAEAAASLNDDSSAIAAYREALTITRDAELIVRALAILGSVGHWFIRGARRKLGIQLLAFVQTHPAAEQETRELAERRLAESGEQNTSTSITDWQIAVTMTQQTLEVHAAVASPAHSAPALVEPLSERELEILTLLAGGLTNQEIASRLVLALGTVKAHNHNIFSKLGVDNRVRAIARAKELGLL